MNTSQTLKLMLACFVLLSLSFGCESKRSALWKRQQQLIKEEDKLYYAYLEADLNRAREILQHQVRLHESQTILAQAGFRFEHILFLDYSRLYVLEKRSGNEDSAEAALIKARYWLLRGCELDMLPPARLNEQVRTANAEQIFSMVEEQDKARTGGKGPRYFQQISPGKPK